MRDASRGDISGEGPWKLVAEEGAWRTFIDKDDTAEVIFKEHEFKTSEKSTPDWYENDFFIKGDMVTYINSPWWVQKPISFIIRAIAYEDASSWAKLKFMFVIRSEIRETCTTKDS